MHGLQPNVQLDMAALENGPDLDGKGLPAGIAFVDADPGALALQGTALIDRPAMRAGPSVGPNAPFDEGVSGLFRVESGGGKDRCHVLSPNGINPIPSGWVRQLEYCLACAYASEAAYELDAKTRQRILAPAGLVEVRYIEGREDARALICRIFATGETILAPQGTQFSAGEIASILENLKCQPIDLGGRRLVDDGYWEQTQILTPLIGPCDFDYVTGHSMGGSIGNLYGGTASGRIGKVITFAAPKCAGLGFWTSPEMPASRLPERWVYGRDPAPDWPAIGYEQPGAMQWLHDGVLTETRDRGELVDEPGDHWIANHIAALEKLISAS